MGFAAMGIAGCARAPFETDTVVTEQYIHKYGFEVPGDDWEERGRDGSVITTLSSGVVVHRNFAQGELDGEVTYTYPYNDIIQRREVYSQGMLLKRLEYNAYGSPQKEVIYQGPEKFTTKLWYNVGEPRSVETYVQGKLEEGIYFTPNNEIESKVQNGSGWAVERTVFGELISKSKIVNGERSIRRTFYPNGAPEWDETYVNDRLEGERTHYLLAGEPDFVERYKAGQKSGMTITFNAGEKLAETPYVNGMKEGVEKKYRNGRDLVEEITWKKGQRHGPSNTYVGGSKKVDWYFEDRAVTEAVFQKLSIQPHPTP